MHPRRAAHLVRRWLHGPAGAPGRHLAVGAAGHVVRAAGHDPDEDHPPARCAWHGLPCALFRQARTPLATYAMRSVTRVWSRIEKLLLVQQQDACEWAVAGGATALIASVAKPLPRWAGFILVPCVTLSSVSTRNTPGGPALMFVACAWGHLPQGASVLAHAPQDRPVLPARYSAVCAGTCVRCAESLWCVLQLQRPSRSAPLLQGRRARLCQEVNDAFRRWHRMFYSRAIARAPSAVPCIAWQAVIMTVALLVNNLHHKRRYPTYWWGAPSLCDGVLR